MKKVDLTLLLLAVGAFLAPLLGGQLLVEPQAVAPSGIIPGLTNGDLSLTPHAIVGALFLIACAVGVVQRRVLQVPNQLTSATVLGLLGLIIASMGVSRFRFASQSTMLEWLSYGAALFAVVALAGRRRGPALLVGCVASGSVLLALKALAEYSETRSPMFAGWNNPNALAGMLLVGFFCCLGLAASLKERFAVPLLGAVAAGFSLVLTQSKGGLLVLGVVSLLFLVLLALWLRGEERGTALKRIGLGLGLVVVLVGGLQVSQSRATTAGAPSGAPLGRVTGATETQAQSFTFRKLLYKTSLDLVRENPVGTGIGTFYYYSAKPGLVTSTVLGHNTVLQLAAECSPLAAVAFLFFAGLLGYHLLRGAKGMTAVTNALRAGVFCALAAVGCHSLIESSFSYFGLGITAFLLAGVGLLLASDAVAPEHVPAPARGMAALCCVFTLFGLLVNARLELGRSQAMYGLASQDQESMQAGLGSIEGLSSGDPMYWNLRARTARSAEERLTAVKAAARVAPQPRTLRQIARLEADAGRTGEAITALSEALSWDPNNLLALRQQMDLERSLGRDDAAVDVAKRLVAVEGKTYFTVRSIAELIPTETYAARLFLAQRAASDQEKRDLLLPALDGYLRFASITVPQVMRFVKGGDVGYLGESRDTALTKVGEGQQVADLLEKAGGDPEKIKAARDQFRAAIEALG